MMRKAVFNYKDFLEGKRKELGLDVLDNEQRLMNLYNLGVNRYNIGMPMDSK